MLTSVRTTAATVGAISTHPPLVEALGASAQLEHMESYAAAYACQQADVPFFAVLGIANRVGPDAHAEWLAHRAQAEAAAQQVLHDAVAAGLLRTTPVPATS